MGRRKLNKTKRIQIRLTEPAYETLKEIIDYYAADNSDMEGISVSKFVEDLIFEKMRNYHAMKRRRQLNSWE